MFFKNTEERIKILNSYNLISHSLKNKFTSEMVQTTLGSTHVLKSQQSIKPPLFLIHGSNSCAPMILKDYEFLTRKYNVYAVDVLGEPNKSEQNRISKKNNDLGKWIYELIDYYNLSNVSLVGVSFGGYIALKTILYQSNKIERLFLISSAGIVNPNFFHFYNSLYRPLKRYVKNKQINDLELIYNVLFTDENHEFKTYLSNVLNGYGSDMTITPLFSKKELKSITTSVSIIASDNDILFPGKKLIKKANNLFGNLDHVLLLKNHKHVRGQDSNDEVNKVF